MCFFGAKMPSVLAEVSFISNPVEEKLLSKESYREYIAKGMADGADTYVATAPQCKKWQGFRDPLGRKDNFVFRMKNCLVW